MTIYLGSVIGDLPSSDVFQFGLHMDDSGALTLADVDTAFRAAVGVLWNGNGGALTGIKKYYIAATTVTSVRTASINTANGRQLDALAAADVLAGTHAGGSTLPQEVAIAVTTRGANANRRSRGRFFLPAPASDQSTSSGRLVSASQVDIADHVQAMMQSLTGDAVTPVIWHRDLLSSTTITRVDVGDVFDAQRRRRDKLVEVREERTI